MLFKAIMTKTKKKMFNSMEFDLKGVNLSEKKYFTLQIITFCTAQVSYCEYIFVYSCNKNKWVNNFLNK